MYRRGDEMILRNMALGLVALTMCLAGCGSGGRDEVVVTPGDAPKFTTARVEYPEGFSYGGGTVTLKAVLLAENDIASVKATIAGPTVDGEPTGTYHVVNSNLRRLVAGYFSSTFVVGPNTRSDGKAEMYIVDFTAVDSFSLKASAAAEIVVPAAIMPPPPPK